MRWRRVSWVVLYIAIRLVVAAAATPAVFNDTGDYQWKGAGTVRPYGISLLFEALGDNIRIVIVQTILASLLWCWLFMELHAALPSTSWLRRGIVGSVILLSLSRPLAMWDRAILSESLSLGLLAAGAALVLRAQRDRRPRMIGYAVLLLLAMALTREVVLFLWGFPIITIVFGFRRGPIGPRMVLAGIAIVAASVALRPTVAPYGPNGATIANYRVMNVIGVRILPDPFLRSRLAHSGLPSTDANLHGAFGFSNDWKLYRSPGMLAFANDFPNVRYVLAELRRPGAFYRYVAPALGSETIRALDQFGYRGSEVIPIAVERVLWNWTPQLHLALLLLSTGARCQRRKRTSPAFTVWTVAIVGGWIGTGDAAAARMFDTLEQGRHAFPFMATSRVALVVSLLCFGATFIDECVVRRNSSSSAASESFSTEPLGSPTGS